MNDGKMLAPGGKPVVHQACCSILAFALAVWFCGSWQAEAQQLVSVRNPNVAVSTVDYQNSTAPVVSADGRYVVFLSSARNMQPGGNHQLSTDVYLRDRLTQTTILVSTNMFGTGGGNGNSGNAALSSDNRYVLFESEASDLVAGDTLVLSNVFANDRFVRDLQTATTIRVSVSMNGGAGFRGSSEATMTPDGRYVAFVSQANDLVPGDTNNLPDVFVRDLLLGSTTLASVGASGSVSTSATSQQLAITPDGRFVVFVSSGEIYRRDLLGGTTLWASSNLNADFGLNPPSLNPRISDDGRYISYANSSVAPGKILRFDAVTGSNTLITAGNQTAYALNNPEGLAGPAMTPDGRYVVYTGESNVFSNIRLWDSQTQTNVVVSKDQSGAEPANAFSDTPVITPNGRFVLYLSTATNLVTNSVVSGTHLYLRDRQTDTNFLVDVDTNGAGSIDIAGASFSMSPDGRYVAFSSPDGFLAAGDTNRGFDVFLRDMMGGTTELISARGETVAAQTASGTSSSPQVALSMDGHQIVFTSRAENLVTNDFNKDQDVFVRNLTTGTTMLASVGTNGNSASGGWSGTPALSADGRFVAFVSIATNLLANYTNQAAHVFLRDLQAGITSRVSVGTGGVELGNGDASDPLISQDGRYVAFLFRTNVASANVALFWRDTITGQTVVVNPSVSTTALPSMSAEGRYLGFYETSFGTQNLIVWDQQGLANVYLNHPAGSAPTQEVSPSGTRLLYQVPGSNRVYAVDFLTQSNLLSALCTVAVSSRAQWSYDARFVTFVTPVGLLPMDTVEGNDIYLSDLQTGILTLVSLNSNHTASANGASDSPVMSGNGRFIIYRSLATDIAPGIVTVPNLVLFDRYSGSNTLLALEQPASSWSPWIGKPALSFDGSTATFQSVKAGFAPDDLNGLQHVFSILNPSGPATDSDGDGIPDGWTLQNFGHPDGQAGDLSRATDDADGDGMNNLKEYLAGTDPRNASSVLGIRITAAASSNTVTLNWAAVPGKSYKVQFKNDLSDATWQDAEGSVSLAGFQGSFTATRSGPRRYYVVVALN